MSEIIFSVSGVRGITGDNLTPYNIAKFTSAFAEYCRSSFKNKNKIAVGRDGRLHGDIIANLVISNLLLSGFEVIDIGIAPTPTVQIATEDLNCCGGISVTASHNPQIWNGLKFLNPDGTFLDSNQITKLNNFSDKEIFHYAEINGIKSVTKDNTWIYRHIEKVLKLKLFNISKIRKRKFKIVVDAVNSSGSEIVPMLLEELGCKVIKLFCDGSGIFPHTPEPLPENLTLLADAVKKYKADFGISVDPDADRLVLITDKGEPFGEENTITSVVNFTLKNLKRGNNVTVNLSTTRAVDDISKKYCSKVFRSPVGEINVVKEMKKNKSVIGGEGSGGVIYPGLHYGRDSIIGIAMMLNEFADFSGTVSEYRQNLPRYFISKTKIDKIKNPETLLRNIEKSVLKDKNNPVLKIHKTDGLKIDFKDFWVHLRKSNTEPVIRIITEAVTMEKAVTVQNHFRDLLRISLKK